MSSMRTPIPALLMMLSAASVMAEELPKAEGMDVIRAAKAIKESIQGRDPGTARGKPWADDIAGITDPRQEVHTQAMAALIRRGEEVVPDLVVLATDQDWHVRQRVAAVLANIGGEQATAAVLKLCDDRVRQVAEVAIIGLGECKGSASLTRLTQALKNNDTLLRQAAAKGLSLLGDPAGMALLAAYAYEKDDLVKRDMREGLARLANRATSIPMLSELIMSEAGAKRNALLEATAGIGDPRLCPAITSVLSSEEIGAVALAARLLAANGDSRAIGPLCLVAARSKNVEAREYAAATLRLLTGYNASAGVAWELWWRDNMAKIEALYPRDELLAALHDPTATISREQMLAIPVEQLTSLIDGALGQGAAWWPRQAFRAMAADDPARWTQPFAQRIEDTFDQHQRVRLIVMLDQLNDPAAKPLFQKWLDRLENQTALKAATLGQERIAIEIALERRSAYKP